MALFSKGILRKGSKSVDGSLTFQNSMKSCLIRLKMRGYSPRNVVDIGAFDGQWTVMLKSVFRKANVLMIEAQKSKKNALEKICHRYSNSVKYRMALLGKEEGETDFYISAIDDTSGSTLFPESTNVLQNPVKMKALPLDSILDNNFICDFLKLDVQGAELDVLNGARRTLMDVQVIVMEVAILQYNRGPPLIVEVETFA